MITIVKTTSGSTYHLDLEAKTWKRTERVNLSGKLRTEEGTFLELLPLKINTRMTMLCPPITEGTDLRLISTSPVKSIN